MPSLPDVELPLCVDAPRVVEPRKALARPQCPPFSQIIFITRLFKVITGKAWGTLHKHRAIRIIYRPAGRLEEITACCHVGSLRVTRFLSSTRTEIRPRCVTPFTCKQTTLLPFLSFFLRYSHVATLLQVQRRAPQTSSKSNICPH